MTLAHQQLTDTIINAFFAVYNALGYGFLEKVYENSLLHELHKRGLKVEAQKRLLVYYDGVVVGEYFADLLVEDKIILGTKSG